MLFAILPLVAVIILHALAGTLTVQSIIDSPEILFFSLMISASVLGDLHAMPSQPARWDWIIALVWAVLLFGVILSTLLYGFLIYDTKVAPGPSIFRENLLWVSLILATFYGIMGTVVQVWIGKIAGPRSRRAK